MKNEEKMPAKPKAVQSKLMLNKVAQERNQNGNSESSSEWSSLSSQSAAGTKKSATKRSKIAPQRQVESKKSK